MSNQCDAINDKKFRCLLWVDHEGDHDWDTPMNPLYTLEHRIIIQDFLNKGFSAELNVYGPDGVVYASYFAAKVEIDKQDAPQSLRYLVTSIEEVVGQS